MTESKLKIDDLKLYPNDSLVLRAKNDRIDVFDDELVEIVEEMKYAMTLYGGIGLAAPQVGLNKQIFVWLWGTDIREIINPILHHSKELTEPLSEGCLSIPDKIFNKKRAQHVMLNGYDMRGEQVFFSTIGFQARILQHEYDHIQGSLICDY